MKGAKVTEGGSLLGLIASQGSKALPALYALLYRAMTALSSSRRSSEIGRQSHPEGWELEGWYDQLCGSVQDRSHTDGHGRIVLGFRRRRWTTRGVRLAPLPVTMIAAGIGILVFAVGREVWEFVAPQLQFIGIGLACALMSGALITLLLARERPTLDAVEAPDPEAIDPARELSDFASRCATRARRAYHLQLGLVVGVAGLLLGLVIWAIAMVSMSRLQYGIALGSGSVA